jgi:copper chaperone
MPTIRVKGMSCQHCVKAVKEALEDVAGVRNVRVDLVGGTATYEEEGSVDREALRQSIEKAGYELA